MYIKDEQVTLFLSNHIYLIDLNHDIYLFIV